MADRFYVRSTIEPGLLILSGPEAHHLAVVCRLRPGAPVTLFNGDGLEYTGRVLEAHRREVTIEVEAAAAPQRELAHQLDIAAPLPKGDRAHFLIEKLTELGVSAYYPLQTDRSVVHPGDAKLDKLERYVVEASKQCGRNTLLRVMPLFSWKLFCKQEKGILRLVAHPSGISFMESKVLHPAEQSIQGVHRHIIAVGPEGGFTDEEVDLARDSGWEVVSLGPRILRVETAALAMAVACGGCLA